MPVIEIKLADSRHNCVNVSCPKRAAMPVEKRNPAGANFSQDESVSITGCLAKYIGGDGFCEHFVKMNKEHLWCLYE